MVKLFLKNSNLCDHNSPTSQTDRQTTCDRNTALCTKVHRAVITSRQPTLDTFKQNPAGFAYDFKEDIQEVEPERASW